MTTAAAVAAAAATGAAVAVPVAVAIGTDVPPLVLALLLLGAHPDPLRVRMTADSEIIDVVASEHGFEPRVINLRKGESVRLRLTTADREHCFALDAYRVEKRILPGRATVVDLTPEKAGTFAFNCCIEEGAAADKEHGRLVVVE